MDNHKSGFNSIFIFIKISLIIALFFNVLMSSQSRQVLFSPELRDQPQLFLGAIFNKDKLKRQTAGFRACLNAFTNTYFLQQWDFHFTCLKKNILCIYVPPIKSNIIFTWHDSLHRACNSFPLIVSLRERLQIKWFELLQTNLGNGLQ